ncbi:WD repeat domain phosphoinositide-interacting protein 2-like [Brevipalpus obovatus]|uniref:WD repeat domain phosphoinositide-interacting protein 2-like n=1 Tax=Brevipalpus obovatus TaxID=246614 RepID=UPI003D9E2E39
MNLARGSDEGRNYLYVGFNQDSTSLSVGTRSGLRLISFVSTDELKMITGCPNEEIFIAERCFSTSIVGYVSLSSPRKLCFLHVEKKKLVVDPRCYSNSILAVKMNRKRIIVVLEDIIYIHGGLAGEFMSDLHRIKPTPLNKNGLCALSPSEDSCLMAYPGGPKTGEVIIYDCLNLQDKMVINAHDNPLAALAFDYDGHKIATASEKGTILRVHSVMDGNCLYEFRRSFTRCADIYSLSFGFNSPFLCASSNTETIHIFKLDNLPPDGSRVKDDVSSQSWINYLGHASENYLPTNISKVFNQCRSFAYARLPLKNLETVCTITAIDDKLRLLVASADGYLYIYDLNISEGGECNLIRQHQLDEIPPNSPQEKRPAMSYAAAVRGIDRIAPVASVGSGKESSPVSTPSDIV